MLGAGVHPGDLLIVDRALEATDGKIVVAVVDGELLVKRLRLKDNRVYLNLVHVIVRVVSGYRNLKSVFTNKDNQ